MFQIISLILDFLLLILIITDIYFVKKQRDLAEETVDDMWDRLEALEAEVDALKGDTKESEEKPIETTEETPAEVEA